MRKGERSARQGVVLVAAVAAALAAARVLPGGCSQREAEAVGQSSSAGPAAGAPGVGAARTVHLSAWTIGPESSSYTRKTNLIEGARRLDADLAAAGDGRRVSVDVDFATTTNEAYAKKLVFAFASGRAPDIVCGGHELVGQFGAAGDLWPLDAALAARPGFRGDFYPVLWQAMRQGGHTYGVPQDNEVRLMYLRADLLERLGWSAADITGLEGRVEHGDFTLDDLAQLGEDAVARGVVAPQRGIWHRNRTGFDWLQLILAEGGRLQDPRSGRLVLSRGAALRTFRLFARLTAHDVTPPGMSSYPTRTIYAGFVSGKVLVYLTGGSWHKLEWQTGFGLGDAAFRKDVVVAPIPGGAAAGAAGSAQPGSAPRRPEPVSVSHPFACMVNARAADPELAFRVIQRSLDPDLDVRHALGSSHLVVRQSAGRSPAYLGDPFLQRMIGYLRFTHFAPNSPRLALFQRILYDGIRGVEVGALSPEGALDFVVRTSRARLGDDVAIED